MVFLRLLLGEVDLLSGQVLARDFIAVEFLVAAIRGIVIVLGLELREGLGALQGFVLIEV